DAVNDRRVSRMPAQRVGDLRIDVQLRDHAVEKIGAIEGADQHRWIVQAQLLDDIEAHALGGGRGVGVKAGVAETRLELRQLPVFQAEVMAPLTDAMRLVDREGADVQALGKLKKTW